MINNEKLNGLKKRFAQMRAQQQKNVSVWREISNYITPNRGNYSDEPPNQGKRDDEKLIDPTPQNALDYLQAAMMGGMTSPSNPWFKLQVTDPVLAAIPSVMKWTDDVKDRISNVLSNSNAYKCLHGVYGEIAAFGIGAYFVEDDWDGVINVILLTAGEYCVAFNVSGKPNAFGRNVWMTASQMVSEFGELNVSEAVKQAVISDAPETWFKVCHLICEDRNHETRFPFMSVYWEDGKENALSVGGYEEFPVLVPRWDTRGNDFYGYGPGWKALGEVKMLHELRKDYLTAQQMSIQPPVYGPSELRERRLNLFPGGMNYTDKDAALKPIFQVNPDIPGQMAAIQQSQDMINKLFYSDLFILIAGADNPQWTAFEVQVRQQEKLQILGPVIQNLIHELYDPLIERVFSIMNRRGMFSEPPEELYGQEIKIEYVSTFALAQKASGLSEINNLLGVIGQVAQFNPEVTDKLKADAIVDQYINTTNIPATIIRADDEIDAMRQQRAQQAQQAQEMAAMQQIAGAAKQGAGAVKDLGATEGILPPG
jgi:hypothetical protein